jgi:hypothetical protein
MVRVRTRTFSLQRGDLLARLGNKLLQSLDFPFGLLAVVVVFAFHGRELVGCFTQRNELILQPAHMVFDVA